MKLTRILPLLGVALFVAGCAVSPQQVAIEPDVDERFPSASSDGITVSVRVQDSRPTTVLGTLGGTYSDSSTLTASNDIVADMETLLAGKLTDAGYDVVSEGARFQLRVDLRELSYERDTTGVGSEVRVVADLGMRIEEGSASAEQNHRRSRNQSRATRPTQEDNKMFVEEVLSEAISGLVRGERLNAFLAR